MHVPVDTDNLLDHACDGADVMGHDYNGHAPIQLMQKPIQLFFELVVNEIRRFVENQQLRVGYDGPTQERPLQLSTRNFTHRTICNVSDTCCIQ